MQLSIATSEKSILASAGLFIGMSDFLKHECGIAMIRLLKPLGYYQEKYGTALYGFNQLFLLMEKQHNRARTAGSVASSWLPPAVLHGARAQHQDNPLTRIFRDQLKAYQKKVDAGVIHPEFTSTVKEHFDFGGEILLGHLRYGTSGGIREKLPIPSSA